jgi:glycine cleavage system H protein
MNIPKELKYTKSDEWIRVEGNEATMGVSDFAQSQLSDVVYVEIHPAAGEQVAKGKPVASVESVKAAAEVYLPVGGIIRKVNDALSGTPELLNQDPYGKGWMVKFTIADPSELDGLMDAATYTTFCAGRAH